MSVRRSTRLPDLARRLPRALFTLAAAKVRNPQAFVLGVASLMNMAVDGNLTSEWPAVVCKGFFGMDFTPDGIDFRPIVPVAFAGDKTLGGFRYRDAVFDIVMHGTGDRIATFAVDSVSLETPRLPASHGGPSQGGHHPVRQRSAGAWCEHRRAQRSAPRPAAEVE